MSNLTRRRETGAILVLKVPTGALKRRKRILTREPRDNKDLCLSKDNKKTGVIEVSILINGAMRKSREERVRRLLMINLYTRDQPRLLGKFLEKLHQSMTGKSHTLLLSKESKRKTGAILVSREPTGAPRRRPRILMRGLRDNKDLCLSRDNKRTGATEVSTPINGATRRSREERVRRPLMINLSTKDQPRLLGKFLGKLHQSTTGNNHIPYPNKPHNLLLTEETGATLALRELTGALLRRLLT